MDETGLELGNQVLTSTRVIIIRQEDEIRHNIENSLKKQYFSKSKISYKIFMQSRQVNKTQVNTMKII